MILIADSGSTKTSWTLTEAGSQKSIQGPGLNPFFIDTASLTSEIGRVFKKLGSPKLSHIYFYGTGIIGEEQSRLINDILCKLSSPEQVIVKSDLQGAYHALFGMETGIAAILGTGASSGYFEKGKLMNQVPSLGFWLGDEGSGSDLGKRLIKAYLRKEMTAELISSFEDKFGSFERALVFQRIKEPRPNAWFASFTPFLKDNEDHPLINNLLEMAFDEFVEKTLVPYRINPLHKVGIVGSVAYYFEPFLRRSLAKYLDNEVVIMKDPMPGLIDFHVTNVQ